LKAMNIGALLNTLEYLERLSFSATFGEAEKLKVEFSLYQFCEAD